MAVEIFLELRSTFDKPRKSEDTVINKYTKHGTLIIDDLGAEKLSEYVLQTWYMIISKRYNMGYPTIYTSNLTPAQLVEHYGERLASRVLSGEIIKITGSDYRIRRK